MLCCLLPGIAPSQNARSVDGYAAMVNGKIITRGDVLELIHPNMKKMASQFDNRDEYNAALDELFQDGLKTLIEKELMLAEMEAEGIQIPPGATEAEVRQDIADRFGGNETAFREMLNRDGKTMEDYRAKKREELILDFCRLNFVYNLASVSPRRVRKVYEENLAELTRPAMVQFRMIILPYQSPEEQTERLEDLITIRKLIQNESDFAQAATAYSRGPNRENAGDFGKLPLQVINPMLRQEINKLKPGEISQPFAHKNTANLLYLSTREESDPPTFTEAQQKIERLLLMEERARLYDAFIGKLKSKYPIKIYLPGDP